MARLQILELPEGDGDDRPPFVLVVDQLPADGDGALSRVRALPEQPQVMDAQHPDPSSYLHGYGVAIREAKRATWNQPASVEE